VIELARHISEVDVGSMIAVIADDPAAAADIPAWCRMRGHAYVRAKNHEDDAKSYVISRRY
jgi:tRNA 2-thiouridine synthesizing protein A